MMHCLCHKGVEHLLTCVFIYVCSYNRAFIGLTWIPKATVQAALGSVPLTLVEEVMDHDDPDFDKYEKWGNDILVTAVFSILITAPIGLVVISELGPR